MSRKRSRNWEGGTQKWDGLPWKAIEPPLERDDGWQSMGGEEQALLYTLEEISGSDYCLRDDPFGGSQMVLASNASALGGEAAAAPATAAALDTEDGGGGGDARGNKKKEKKGKKRKADAAPEEQQAADGDSSSGVAGAGAGAAAAITMAVSDGTSSATAAMEDGGDTETAANDNKGPKKKKRRGQGKKKRAADAALARVVAAADGGGGGSPVATVGADGTPPASTAAVAVPQHEQQHAGEQTAEAAAASAAAAAATAVAAVAGDKPQKPDAAKKGNKKKRKNKKKKKKSQGEEEEGGAGAASRTSGRNWELGEEEAAKMAPWMYLGVELHPALLWHLHRQGFHDPTPIQRRVLPKAVLGRKDIIGAAETGSGKTLAFGLPVLSEILTRQNADAAAAAASEAETKAVVGGAVGGGGGDGEAGEDEEEKDGVGEGLQALVLCPTRELALQVAAHLREVVRDTGLAVVAVVGGLAEVKQQRQLSRRPEVVVATPGRFWEMAGSHAHLSGLENLRHLVVDEADRMLERGHYPELNRLFSMLEKVEGREAEGEGGGGGGGGIGGGGRGGRFKNYQLPFDISERGEWSVPPEEDDKAEKEDEGGSTRGPFDAMDESDGEEGQAGPAGGQASKTTTTTQRGTRARDFSRQTYVFSATLTLGASGRQQRKGGASSPAAAAAAAAAASAASPGKGKKGKGKARSKDEDDPIRKIMKRVGVRGDPAVIDMGRRTVGVADTGGGAGGGAGGGGEEYGPGAAEGGGRGEGAGPPALPSTLKLCSIKSLQMEKDVHAYLFCATYPGRTLIFVNAISIARRLSVLLCSLNVPATPLHAQMQQRQRLKSLDRFTSDPKAVLVATDVAARGLDIPKVEHVVHYDAARSAEVFIHRAGRTARARAAGLSLSIVAPRDDANHRQTCSVLGLYDGMQAFPLDMRMVERARERVGMALRVLKFQEAQNRVSASNDFFRGLSKEADLVMDGDLLMDDVGSKPDAAAQGRGGVKGLGKKGNQYAARLAAEARQALAVALSRPLHSDRRKLIPVAQALTDMRAISERTAAGDLAGKQTTRSGKKVARVP